jgi:ribose transport system ATP-binding protein
VSALFEILANLKRQGLGIVYVSHRMDEVHEICDRATVMRDGVSVATVRLDEIDGPGIVRLIVGRDVEVAARTDEAGPAGVAYLELDRVSCESAGPLSLSVGRGEIVGLTGLAGAGYTAVGEILYGLQRTRDGAIAIAGERFAPTGPVDALARGIVFVPADRMHSGVVTRMTVRENLYLNPGPGHQVYRESRFIRPRAERREALATLTRFDVRPRDTERELSTLSGGNAQKVLLAKWLSVGPDIVVLNEPTTGVDIGAREEIYGMVRRAAADGTTVLVASSDFEEIVRLCGRACIFARGRIVRELQGAELTIDTVTTAAGQGVERSTREG